MWRDGVGWNGKGRKRVWKWMGMGERVGREEGRERREDKVSIYATSATLCRH